MVLGQVSADDQASVDDQVSVDEAVAEPDPAALVADDADGAPKEGSAPAWSAPVGAELPAPSVVDRPSVVGPVIAPVPAPEPPPSTEAAAAGKPAASAAAPGTLAPPEPESPVGLVDPHGIDVCLARLSPSSQMASRVALAIAAATLDPGEQVELLVQGLYQNHAGVAILTDRRVVLVNDHEWAADRRVVAITPDLVVQGWQDEQTASLIFVTEGVSATISLISDRLLAQEFAQKTRARVAEAT